MPVSEDQIKETLKTVKYPGFSRDIVSFGLVKGIEAHDGDVIVQLVLATNDPAIPQTIKNEAENALRNLAGVREAKVRIDIQAPPAGSERRRCRRDKDRRDQACDCDRQRQGRGREIHRRSELPSRSSKPKLLSVYTNSSPCSGGSSAPGPPRRPSRAAAHDPRRRCPGRRPRSAASARRSARRLRLLLGHSGVEQLADVPEVGQPAFAPEPGERPPGNRLGRPDRVDQRRDAAAPEQAGPAVELGVQLVQGRARRLRRSSPRSSRGRM